MMGKNIYTSKKKPKKRTPYKKHIREEILKYHLDFEIFQYF